MRQPFDTEEFCEILSLISDQSNDVGFLPIWWRKKNCHACSFFKKKTGGTIALLFENFQIAHKRLGVLYGFRFNIGHFEKIKRLLGIR